MKKHLKKSLLIGCMLTFGTSSFAVLENMTETGGKWNGASDLKLRVNGTVLDLENKYGLLVRPTKGGVDSDLILDFGQVALGETTDYIDSTFEAFIVSNSAAGELLKYKLVGRNASDDGDVATSLSAKLVARDGHSTTGDDVVTTEGANMESKIYVSDGTNTRALVGTVHHILSAGIEGNKTDYSGTVKSKLVVERTAPAGSFAADAGKLRIEVTNFEPVLNDNGTALENRGDKV